MNIINNLFFINIYIASIFVFLSCTYNNDRSKDQNQKFSLFVENFNNKENNYSNSLNRLNEKNILDELNQVKKELNNLRSINIDSLSNDNIIDYKFIESILVGKEIQYEYIKSWEKDPRDYMNFRQISTNINGPKSCEEKIKFLLEYLPIVKNDLKLI